VVVNPGILDPQTFIDEVVNVRLPRSPSCGYHIAGGIGVSDVSVARRQGIHPGVCPSGRHRSGGRYRPVTSCKEKLEKSCGFFHIVRTADDAASDSHQYNGGYLIKKPTRADRQIKKSTNSSVLFIVIYSDARPVF